MRVVFKIGTAVLAGDGDFSKKRIKKLAKFFSEFHSTMEILIVSSGAVAAGALTLALDKNLTANKQALAAIGQGFLINRYSKAFSKYAINVAQILLSKDDFLSFARSSNAKTAVNTLLKNKVIPIINENDSVVVDELLRGDNDFLSAQVAHYFDADLLVILSDINGFYDKNPKTNKDAKIIKKVCQISQEDLSQEANPNYKFATGGIVTKLKAADFLIKNNKQMLLTSGLDLSYAKEFLRTGKTSKGTLFCQE